MLSTAFALLTNLESTKPTLSLQEWRSVGPSSAREVPKANVISSCAWPQVWFGRTLHSVRACVCIVVKCSDAFAPRETARGPSKQYGSADARLESNVRNSHRLSRVRYVPPKASLSQEFVYMRPCASSSHAASLRRCFCFPPPPLSLLHACFGQVYMKQFGDDFEAGGVEWGGVFLDED